MQKGINAILVAPHTVVPCWVENGSINKFVELKLKMTALVQTLTEIKEFTAEPMPEDNQLAAERKQAQKRSDKLQADLISSCNDLTALTVVPESCFGEDFYDNISMFIETARKNTKAKDKVEQMKTQLSERGVVTQQTSVNSDQVKGQLPIFTGDSSISILDASDT